MGGGSSVARVCSSWFIIACVLVNAYSNCRWTLGSGTWLMKTVMKFRKDLVWSGMERF